MVREAVTRHVERGGARPQSDARFEAFPSMSKQPSHMLLPLARGSDGDGACLIEPSVRCSHCGYCLSYGH